VQLGEEGVPGVNEGLGSGAVGVAVGLEAEDAEEEVFEVGSLGLACSELGGGVVDLDVLAEAAERAGVFAAPALLALQAG
jgi:hypothetical protein